MSEHISKKALVAIVGAGPIGLELAIALKKAHISYVQFDKGQVAQMIYNFPPDTHFFSSSERIGIAGIPIQTLDQQKCTREQYLAYIRSVVMHYKLHINTYEEVKEITKKNGGFLIRTNSSKGELSYEVESVVLATGGTSHPRKLNIEGEDLPHVDWKMIDPHKYFQKNILVIGGKNSAAETCLRCYNAGAFVTLVTRKSEFPEKSIKYWILPDLLGRIYKKEITCYYNTAPKKIYPDRVLLSRNEEEFEIPADFVIKAIGFEADMSLFSQVGIPLTNDQQVPSFDDETMETIVPGIYVLGTVMGGTQKKFNVFIENCHIHVTKVLQSLSKKFNFPLQESISTPSPNAQLEE